MTNKEFWNNIIITEEEKAKSLHYLQYRGVDEHDHVRQHLESITGRKVSYAEIATAFRYDKRIRRILYKYIGFLEERIRAFISNKYSDSVSLTLTSSTQQQYEEQGELFLALSSITYGQLISQTKKLSCDDKQKLFSSYNSDTNLAKDLDATVALRNEVSHNRFLLDNKRLKKCSVGDGNCSLWANIINLRNCLPELFRERFSMEINECAKENDANYTTQTQWQLIDALIVKI